MTEKVEIDGEVVEYRKVYRGINLPRFEFKEGELFIYLPFNYREEKKLIEKHKRWIKKHYLFFKEAKNIASSLEFVSSPDEKKFKEEVIRNVKEYCKLLNVEVRKIKFRKMKNKWGYCTSKGEITINTYLKFLPSEMIEYVSFHEVAHLVESKHTKNFYQLMKSYYPDMEEKDKKLASYYILLEKNIF